MNDIKNGVINNLSKDILVHILEYDGRFKYENGKFQSIIAKNDPRYDVVEKVTSHLTRELSDIADIFTNKDRWMVVINLSRNRQNSNQIGLSVFSNWREPDEWCHVWYNHSNYFIRCVDLPLQHGDNCYVTQPKIPRII